MPDIITDALVIRRADYGDYDRMLTLFSPTMGRVDAIARGCKRAKSALLNAAEPFCAGEYQLYHAKDRVSVKLCLIRDSFYELRTDYQRLTHGAYWLRLLDEVILPGQAMPELFLMSLRALAHLNYSDLPAPLLTAMFEMQLAQLCGFAPRMDACVVCGRSAADPMGFSPRGGGVVCPTCAPDARRISQGARRILLKAPRTRFDSVRLLLDRPEWPEAASCIRTFLDTRMSRALKNAPPAEET